jgi:protein TonB
MVPANVLATMHRLPHRAPVFSAVRAPDEGTRRWTLAVVLALAVQAGLVAVVSWSAGHAPVVPARPERPEIEVVFQAHVPRPAPVPAPAPAPAKLERRAAPRPVVPAEVAAPVPEVAPARPSLPEVSTPSEAVAPGEPALVATSGDPAGATASAPTSSPAGEAPGAAGSVGLSIPGGKGSGGDGADLDAYGAHLSRAVTAHRRYPTQARRLRLEGTAVVEVDVARDGALVGAPVISRSSGHAVLDEEALRMVRAAAPFEALPAGLAGTTAHFVLPIRFGIRDGVSH